MSTAIKERVRPELNADEDANVDVFKDEYEGECTENERDYKNIKYTQCEMC